MNRPTRYATLAALCGAGLLLGRAPLIALGLLIGVGLSVGLPLRRAWAGPRAWYRVRYHAPTPPDPAAVWTALRPQAGPGALVLCWRADGGALTLWLEAPIAQRTQLQAALASVLAECRLARDAPPPWSATSTVQRGRLAARATALPPLYQRVLDTPGPVEARLVLLNPQATALLWQGPAHSAWTPASPRFLSRLPAGPVQRLHTWLTADPWPAAAAALGWPATTLPATAALESRAAYHLAPTPPAAAPTAGDWEVGRSTVTGAAVTIPVAQHAALWRGHFLSLGRPPTRTAPLGPLAQAAYAAGRPILALDETGDLLPQVEAILLDPACRTTWISCRHPQRSLRFNLLAVPPLGAPGPLAEVRALHLALTSVLPLFGYFLTRLGIPWHSTHTGGIWLHDLLLVQLLAHHRSRLTGGDDAPVPTLAGLYALLRTNPDLPALLAAETRYWVAATSPLPAGDPADPTVQPARAAVHTLLRAAGTRWATVPAPTQAQHRATLRTMLHPIVEAPGFAALWQGTTAPTTYFAASPAPLLLTQLVPAQPTERDHTLAGWYTDYLLLCLRAVAAQRQASGQSDPPLLVLCNRTEIGNAALPATALDDLGATGISCAVAAHHLPPYPEGAEWLDRIATWWIYALTPEDQATIQPYLTPERPEAAELALTHLPHALLRTTIPKPQLATVYSTPAQPDVLSRVA